MANSSIYKTSGRIVKDSGELYRPACNIPSSSSSSPAGFGQIYGRWLDEEPVATKACTSFVLSSMSSLVAQLITSGGQWSGSMPLEAAKFGITKIPPYSHFWYPILDRINNNPLFRVFVDQIFWRPLLTAYTILFMSLAKGLTWAEIREKYRSDYWSAVKAGLRIWPACEIVNQQAIPLKWRSVFKDCVGFFWDVYLTMVSTATVNGRGHSSGTTDSSGDNGGIDGKGAKRAIISRRVSSVHFASLASNNNLASVAEDSAETEQADTDEAGKKRAAKNPVIPITGAIVLAMYFVDAASRRRQKHPPSGMKSR